MERKAKEFLSTLVLIMRIKLNHCNKITNVLYFIDSAPVGRADTFTTCLAI